ncbi:MAG TPA: asparagine synthase (glutamine-hydrolyzing) [Terriglobia bacterium]|nr:asparagine synthase (glutamine-hydrolyzing) [Terriglobia bacterium]
MCGIAGFITTSSAPSAQLKETVVRMTDQIVHRGPDDSGAWVDAESGVALGSRRLAIVDLSPAGHQPMLSSCGRFVMVYNGEVYNFSTLREELSTRGRKFRGHSDTEVILTAIAEWGLEAAVKKFVGMFAFAVWDQPQRTLHLVRDRLGIKPLYYGWAGKNFLFGSELKALRAHPEFDARINRDAIALYMRYNYIPAPYSIYQQTFKLPPGGILSVPVVEGSVLPQIKPSTYWSAKEIAERGAADPFTGSDTEAVEQLDALLRDSVKLRMIADVPLGAFLSGGIDSSTVVALMQAQSSRRVRTFTIGFTETKFNEAEHAKAVATHLGTEHTELYVTPAEAQAVIPKLPLFYDEPFSDSSQIPTFLVSELARRHVTVSLSGDGGDELFGGYPRYFRSHALWKKMRWLPGPARRAMAGLLSAPSVGAYNRRLGRLVPWADRIGRPATVGEKMHKLSEALPAHNREALYRLFGSHSKRPIEFVPGATEPLVALTDPTQWAALPDYFQQMMFFDIISYLPDDILTKVDRASMAVSLEARVPLIDHRVVEFAARVPTPMKIRQGTGKWLLRQVLYRYVPKDLIERPKMGFAVPIDAWLRQPLREWAEALLNEDRLKREGYLNPVPIRKIWAQHISGERNRADMLWDVLMFQAWREQWV